MYDRVSRWSQRNGCRLLSLASLSKQSKFDLVSFFLETSGYILSPNRDPLIFFFHFVVFLVIIIGVRGCFAVPVVIRGFKNNYDLIG